MQRHAEHHAQVRGVVAGRLLFDQEVQAPAGLPVPPHGGGTPHQVVLGSLQIGADLTRRFPAHVLQVEFDGLSNDFDQIQQSGHRHGVPEHPAEAGIAQDPGHSRFDRAGRERGRSVEWGAIRFRHRLLVCTAEHGGVDPARDDGPPRLVPVHCHCMVV